MKTKTRNRVEKKIKIKTVKVVKKPINKPLINETEDSGKKYLNLLLEGKKSAKEEILCKFDAKGECKNQLGLNKIPLILIFATDLNGKKELIDRETLFKFLEGLAVTNAKAIVIDTEEPSDIANLNELGKIADKRLIWYNPISDNSEMVQEEKEIDRLLLAADMALIFNHHLELIQLLQNYGVVIVGEDSAPLLEDYNPNHETGTSFTYHKKDVWGIFAATLRALETFKFPYDWQNIIRKIYK